MKHYVYILTNELFHDKDGNQYVKIGVTDNIPRRMKELAGTGVPVQFDLFFAFRESRQVLMTIRFNQAPKVTSPLY